MYSTWSLPLVCKNTMPCLYTTLNIKPLSKGGKNTAKNTKIVSFADNSSFDRNSDKSVRKNTPGIFKKKTTKKPTKKKATVKRKTTKKKTKKNKS